MLSSRGGGISALEESTAIGFLYFCANLLSRHGAVEQDWTIYFQTHCAGSRCERSEKSEIRSARGVTAGFSRLIRGSLRTRFRRGGLVLGVERSRPRPSI